MHAKVDKSRLRTGARWILATGALLTLAGPSGAWTVTAARLEKTEGTAVLRLAGDGVNGPLPCEVFTLESPWRVVVDLYGAAVPVAAVETGRGVSSGPATVTGPGIGSAPATGTGSATRIGSATGTVPAIETGSAGSAPLVQGIRWSLYNAGTEGEIVRYVIDCGGPVGFHLEPSKGALAVFVDPIASRAEPGPVGEANTPERAAATVPDVEDCPEEEPAAQAAAVVPAVTESSTPATTPVPAVASVSVPALAPVRVPTAAAADPIASTETQDTAPSLGAADAAASVADARPMNLDVQGADIRTVIRSIAEYGGVNIVADREVDGPITVRLTQVPWRQALDVVCRAANLVTLESDGVVRVATLKNVRDEGLEKESSERKREELQPLETQVFNIRYASAKELKDAVSFVLSKRGSANIDERTNTLLVSDIAPRVSEVQKLVGTLDTETRQVEITARLVDVDRTVARQLGIRWALENLHSNAERISGSAGVDELPLTASGAIHLGVVRSFGNLDATIEALERQNQATLISSPKITTVNNRKAKILVGKEVPLIVLDQAGNPTTELKKVGISLEVTPYINSENRITMDLKPEVSDLSSQATVQGGIVFNTTLADTRVMVNDGETAVIGGLIRTSETDFTQGIPLLKSLPLIGALFRSSDTRKENRELLIFVSPRVVEGLAQGH